METKELDFVVAAVQRATVLAVVVVLAAKIAHLHQGHRHRRIKKALAALAVAAIEVRLQYQEHYQINLQLLEPVHRMLVPVLAVQKLELKCNLLR